MSKKFVVNGGQPFTKSNCTCDFCVETHKAVEKWDSLIPETNLQFRMRESVYKIEGKLLSGEIKRNKLKN